MNVIREVWLFPRMVTDVGEYVKDPPIAVPAQKFAPLRLMLFKVKVLPFGPPFAFQVTCTLPMVSVSCGFVIDKAITLP